MATEPRDPAPLPLGRFEGPRAFQQVVREALAGAVQHGWREIVVCDASFEDWPLHEREVTDLLQQWSRTGRRFTMVAAGYDSVVRRHPRFVTWRQRWDHIIECRVCRHRDPQDFPSILWSPAWAMRRLDLVRSTGLCSSSADRRLQMREELDALLAVSGPGFPSTTLGL
jgi:hypothetical protein